MKMPERPQSPRNNYGLTPHHKAASKGHLRSTLRISSLNIGRGLNMKENSLKYTILMEDCDVCSISEVDIEDFDENKPFSIEGYKTYFPLKRTGTNKKRLICFVKNSIEAKQRSDLMSESVANVWLEFKGKNQ